MNERLLCVAPTRRRFFETNKYLEALLFSFFLLVCAVVLEVDPPADPPKPPAGPTEPKRTVLLASGPQEVSEIEWKQYYVQQAHEQYQFPTKMVSFVFTQLPGVSSRLIEGLILDIGDGNGYGVGCFFKEVVQEICQKYSFDLPNFEEQEEPSSSSPALLQDNAGAIIRSQARGLLKRADTVAGDTGRSTTDTDFDLDGIIDEATAHASDGKEVLFSVGKPSAAEKTATGKKAKKTQGKRKKNPAKPDMETEE